MPAQPHQRDALPSHSRGPARTRRSSGASTVESLIVVLLVGMALVGAFKGLSGAYTKAVQREADAVWTLEWKGQNAFEAPPPPPARAPEPPRRAEPESDGGFWGWMKGAAKTVGNLAFELSPLSDVATLLDPNASLLDKGIAALSLLPGPGQAVKWAARGVKLANKVADGAKAADKARDARKAEDAAKADDVDDPLVAGKKKNDSEEPVASADECPNGACRNGTCFAAGTPVHAEDGVRPIEDIREGDLLWSRNERTGEVRLQRVLHRIVTPNRALLRILLGMAPGPDEALRVTPPHPFWTQRGWVAAEDLTLGDEVTLLSGETAPVIGAETLGGGQTVYNFEVEQFHTYFVGHAGAWVHNEGVSPGQHCPDGEGAEGADAAERAPTERPSKRLAPHPFLSKPIRGAYDEILAGRGTRRMTTDPNTGAERPQIYSGRENRGWAGAEEYEVPNADGARVLVLRDENGNITKMGWVNPKQAEKAAKGGPPVNKYKFIHQFETAG